MSNRIKRLIILSSIALYIISIIFCFFCVKKYVHEKNDRLYAEATSKLNDYFGENNMIAVPYFQDEKIKCREVEVDRFVQDSIHKMMSYCRRLMSYEKIEYMWHEAYDDIYKKFEIVPRYNGDFMYTGFFFRIFENNGTGITEYTLYPRYIGFLKQPYPKSWWTYPSNEYVIERAFEYLTTNNNSEIFRCSRNNSTITDIDNYICNEYYELMNYEVCNMIYNGINNYFIHESDILNRWYDLTDARGTVSYFKTPTFESYNILGHNSYVDVAYTRIYLEANPINAYSIHYRSVRGEPHPMLKDMRRLFLLYSIAITLLFFTFTYLVLCKKYRRTHLHASTILNT